MRFVQCLSLLSVVAMVSLAGLSEAQIAPIPSGLDQAAQKVDARLSVPLTFDADQMYLGELLEKVAAKTGVSLSTPLTEVSSGIPITCHIKQIPLIDFINSIWSLVGYSNATWQITTDKQQGNYSYRLLATDASKGYLATLELGMANTIFERWILPGDMRRAEADDKTMNALPATPSESFGAMRLRWTAS